MYWLLNTVDTDPFDSPGGGETRSGFNPLSYQKQVELAFGEAFSIKRIQRYFLTIEEDGKKLNTKIGNGLAENLTTIQSTLDTVYKDGLQYGFAYGDAKEYVGSIGDSMGRMINLQPKVIMDSIALGKSMGITNKEMAEMTASLMKSGFGAKVANEQIKEIFSTARNYGVNAAALTKTVSSNIYLAQGYGFKDGVKGLTEMAAQAQRLGLSFDGLTKTAEMVFDIDKAVEMSSKLQMMGGNFGFLTDAATASHMAATDMTAFNNEMMKGLSQFVEYDAQTGMIGTQNEYNMRMLRETSSAMQLDYKQALDYATKFKRESEIMKNMDLSMFSEDDKSLILSYAELGKGGEVTIKMPGTSEIVQASKLTVDQITELKNQAKKVEEESTKDPLTVAKDQLSVLENMDKSLERLKMAGVKGTDFDKGNELVKTIEKLATPTGMEGLQKKIEGEIGSVTTAGTGLYEGALTALNTTVTTLTSNVEEFVTTLSNAIDAINLNAGTTPPTTSNIPVQGENDVYLPAGNSKYISSGFGDLIKLNNMDASLNIPEDDMKNLFDYANLGEKILKTGPPMLNYNQKTKVISDYVEQKIITESISKKEVTVGGETSVKINIDSNLPDNVLSKLIDNPELKSKVMDIITERMSKEWSRLAINS